MKREDLLFKIKKVNDIYFKREYIGVLLPIVKNNREYKNEVRLFTTIGEVINLDVDGIEVSDVISLDTEVEKVLNSLIDSEKAKYEADLRYLKAYEELERLKGEYRENYKKQMELFKVKKDEIISVQDYLTPAEVEEFLMKHLDIKEGYKLSIVGRAYNTETYSISLNLFKEVVGSFTIDCNGLFNNPEFKGFTDKEFIKIDEFNTSTLYSKSITDIDFDNEATSGNNYAIYNSINISFTRVNHTIEELNDLVNFLNSKFNFK